MQKVIGAVEIGTSKVVVLVGEISGDRRLNIIGMGQSTAMGVRKGEIVDFRAASDAVHAAISAAEKSARATVEGIYLSQSGGHLRGFFDRGTVTVSAPDGLVGPGDVSRAVANAKCKEIPPGRLYIHHVQAGFFLDGQRVEDPLTLRGGRLEVGYWHVHGDERKVSDQIHVINGFGLQVEDVIISSLASASMVVAEPEKRNGVLVIDLGCGTSDYALYKEGCVARTGSVPVGGDHLTNDLSIGLRVSLNHAEKMKCEFGRASVDPADKDDTVWLFGDLSIGDRAIPKKAIHQIINARLDELLSVIKRELGGALAPASLAGGVVLTGGTALLPGIAAEAERVLGAPARVCERLADMREDVATPEYSTVLGLLNFGMNAHLSSPVPPPGRGLFGKVAQLLRI